MHFKQLEVKNYSLFEALSLSFRKDGVHIISGPNASGKTQLFGSFLIPLFSKKAISKFSGSCSEDTLIHLSIVGANNEQEIKCTLQCRSGDKLEYKREIIEKNPSGTDLKKKLIAPLEEGKSPSLVLTHRLPCERISKKDIDVINIAFANSPFSTDYEVDYRYIVETFCKKITEVDLLSAGQRHFLTWLREFSYRFVSGEPFPLIVDDELSLYDPYYRRLISILVSTISLKSQVILFTSNIEYVAEIPKKLIASKMDLGDRVEYQPRAQVGYQYGFLENLSQLKKFKGKEDKSYENYYLNHIYRHEENRLYEFKEIKGNNPVRSIIDTADIYVVSFLNTRRQQNGKIIWGITDEEGRIIGVKVNRQQRDEIRRCVCEKLAQIEPPVVISIFNIEFYKILNESNTHIEDLYLIEITIPVNKSKFFYCTSSKEVYIKTDGGKRKLSPLQLQQEILHRHGVDV